MHGQRSDQSGPLSEIFTVNFGQTPDGMTATVREGIHAPAGGGYEATPSTVDGRVVQKLLPNGNGSTKRTKART